jgi:hypothetical protein
MAMTRSKFRLVYFLALALFAFVLASPAHARPLDEPRRAGLVGEQSDGYLGVVSGGAPADVVRQVQEINAGRRAYYSQIAKQYGQSVVEVGKANAETLVSETRSGEYYRDSSGRWVKRP